MVPRDHETVKVPDDVVEQVRRRLGQGDYLSEGDVLRDAMGALAEREKLEALRAKVKAAVEDTRAPFTADEVLNLLRERARTAGVPGEHG